MDDFVNDFDIEGDRRGYHIPVVADKRGKDNKFDRIESMCGHFERRNVLFNIREKESPDQIRLRDQFLAFEKGSKVNDDGPDAVHGVQELFTITRSTGLTLLSLPEMRSVATGKETDTTPVCSGI
jgi:hypothetical protein